MKTLLLIGFLIIVDIIVLLIGVGLLATGVSKKSSYIFLVTGIISAIWCFFNPHGIVKAFFVLVTKVLISVMCFIVGIGSLAKIVDAERWQTKINTAFSNGLGELIKKNIPKNLPFYEVNSEGIIYPKSSTSSENWFLHFSSLGYENIPPIHADTVCEWIRNNLITNPDSYCIAQITKDTDVCIGVTPSTYNTRKDYAGNYETTYTEGHADYRTKTIVVGYKLAKRTSTTHKSQLNKW